jgi:hypothetical protein
VVLIQRARAPILSLFPEQHLHSMDARRQGKGIDACGYVFLYRPVTRRPRQRTGRSGVMASALLGRRGSAITFNIPRRLAPRRLPAARCRGIPVGSAPRRPSRRGVASAPLGCSDVVGEGLPQSPRSAVRSARVGSRAPCPSPVSAGSRSTRLAAAAASSTESRRIVPSGGG